MLSFEYTSIIEAPVEEVFAFHEQPDALEKLTPPWRRVEVLKREGGIQEGGRVVLSVETGPLRRRWVAVHTRYERNRLFVDVQKEGPFASWVHRHEFEGSGGRTLLTDRISFSLPGGALVNFLAGWWAKLELRRLFRYRHEQTRAALSQRARLQGR
jgi:ligand-binding SRPBCC domain-containing protein